MYQKYDNNVIIAYNKIVTSMYNVIFMNKGHIYGANIGLT